MDKLAPVLFADPLVTDAVLNAALISQSTKDAMFHGLETKQVTVVRKFFSRRRK